MLAFDLAGLLDRACRVLLGIDWLLSLVLIGGSRFALRILAEQSMASRTAWEK